MKLQAFMIISIVIPLYNCENFIDNCLDSIYSSSVDSKDFEVIVVDDGSTDNGLNKVTSYSTRQENLIVRSFENAGASEARNRGLDISRGEYVWFVDADDMISSDSLKTVMDLLEQYPLVDVLSFNHQVKKFDGLADVTNFQKNESVSGLDFLRKHASMYLWDKVYRRSMLDNVRFLRRIRNTEDWLFNIQVMLQASHVQISTSSTYIYNQTNLNSTLSTASLSHLLKNNSDTMYVHKQLLELAERQPSEEKQSLLYQLLNYGVIGIFYAAFVDSLPNDYIRKMIQIYKKNGLYPVVKSYNKKANIFAELLNREWLFLLCVSIKRRIKHPKWM